MAQRAVYCRASRTRYIKWFPCDSSSVQQSCSGAKKWHGWNLKQQLVVCNSRSAFDVKWYEKQWFRLSIKMKYSKFKLTSVRLSKWRQRAHRRFQLASISYWSSVFSSVVWPYLATYFGFFDLRTFPWSLIKVQVSILYPFTLKVGSKCTYIILTSSSVKPGSFS